MAIIKALIGRKDNRTIWYVEMVSLPNKITVNYGELDPSLGFFKEYQKDFINITAGTPFFDEKVAEFEKKYPVQKVPEEKLPKLTTVYEYGKCFTKLI